MSGHSKWSTIKHKKGKTDAQRGKIFTKIIREITSAVRAGGPDINANPRLRLAVDKARDSNMPSDNYERAILKASGGADGVALEEVTYEGYGPAGVAPMVEAITDNKQRTVSDVRNIFSKNGGNMGSTGCVSYIFTRKGHLTFDKKNNNEETLTMAAIDAGAEDIKTDDGTIEVVTTPENFEKVKNELKKQGFQSVASELALVPSTTVTVTGEDAKKVIKLVETLEDNDDVQNVYANFDIPDEILEQNS